MSLRRPLAGFLSAALVGSALAVASAGAAHAAVDPDDTVAFTPVSADMIGVGSDTSQNALFRLANAYNATAPTPTSRLFTYAATGGGNVALPDGTSIPRPNGSSAGKGRLYGTNNTVEIDYARSSSPISDAERNAGLQAFPFALDTLGVAVSGRVASNAPASLSEQQILGIYTGQFTTWAQVGGTSTAAIAPKIPQAGSGSRSFFLDELRRINNGTAPTLAASVAEVQENNPTPIQDEPNAIAPFSVGRAGLVGSALRLPVGFSADRALYNVVRGTDVAKPEISAAFGPSGYVCTEAARPQIEAAGFKQLATAEGDGVCGEATQVATTDFTINTGPALGDDPTFTPESNDLIGVGSDTSQTALALLADGYNSRTPAPANLLASYAATGGGSIQLPDGTVITRPNGSGAGKGRLYGANDTVEIDYARSSSAINDTERNAGLQAFPFALDTLGVAVSGRVASNAPASLSEAQILGIYTGQFTTWTQVGGTSTAAIAPKIPQAGSGSRSFFLDELRRINGGTAPTLAASVAEVQENDPTPIQSDANAIAPFSVGRAGLAGSALRVPSGFAADRALYNVVRGTDVSDTDVQAIFGVAGYVCSDAAADRIEEAGFRQLARPDSEGVCGEATQSATTNFTVNEPVVAVPTSTTLTGSSPAARVLRLQARVSGSSLPSGSVRFTSGSTTLGSAPLRGGVATLQLSNRAPRAYSVTATYVPTAGSAFVESSRSATVRVKAASSIRETFAAKVVRAKNAASGLVAVTFGGTTTKPTGRVVLREGRRIVGQGTLRGGQVRLNLTQRKLGVGKSFVTISYAGNANGFGSTKRFAITFVR